MFLPRPEEILETHHMQRSYVRVGGRVRLCMCRILSPRLKIKLDHCILYGIERKTVVVMVLGAEDLIMPIDRPWSDEAG